MSGIDLTFEEYGFKGPNLGWLNYMAATAHEADYSWYMEDDVWIKDEGSLAEFMSYYSNDNADLLFRDKDDTRTFYHEGNCTARPRNARLLKEQMTLPKFITPQAQLALAKNGHHCRSMFNFARLSQKFLNILDDWRVNRNEGRWVFFEMLFLNIAMDYNLTVTDFHDYPGISFRYRPCWTHAPENTFLLHPVKGNFQECTFDNNYPEYRKDLEKKRKKEYKIEQKQNKKGIINPI
eukprot:Pgem_evm3s15057